MLKIDICVLIKNEYEEKWYKKAKIFESKMEIKEINANITLLKIPEKKGKISRRIIKDLDKILENQKNILSEIDNLEVYKKIEENTSFMSYLPVLSLRKLANIHGIDLTTKEVAIVAPKINEYAIMCITKLSYILRFATIYTDDIAAATALGDDIMEKTGLSLSITDSKDINEHLIITIDENLTYRIGRNSKEYKEVLYELPKFMNKYEQLPAREIFELSCKNLDTEKLFKDEKVKIRGIK